MTQTPDKQPPSVSDQFFCLVHPDDRERMLKELRKIAAKHLTHIDEPHFDVQPFVSDGRKMYAISSDHAQAYIEYFQEEGMRNHNPPRMQMSLAMNKEQLAQHLEEDAFKHLVYCVYAKRAEITLAKTVNKFTQMNLGTANTVFPSEDFKFINIDGATPTLAKHISDMLRKIGLKAEQDFYIFSDSEDETRRTIMIKSDPFVKNDTLAKKFKEEANSLITFKGVYTLGL
jgi:hypothetical protein